MARPSTNCHLDARAVRGMGESHEAAVLCGVSDQIMLMTDPLVTVLTSPAPCDDCRFAIRCGREQLACRQFYNYVNGDPWEDISRIGPSRKMWRKIYVED